MRVRTIELVVAKELLLEIIRDAVDPEFLSFTRLIATIDPANHAGSTATSDVVDTRLFRQFYFVLLTGNMDGVSLGFKLQSSIDGASGWQDIPGRVIEPDLGNDDNRQVVIFLRAADMPAGRPWARGVAESSAGAASVFGMLCLGMIPNGVGPEYGDLPSVVRKVE